MCAHELNGVLFHVSQLQFKYHIFTYKLLLINSYIYGHKWWWAWNLIPNMNQNEFINRKCFTNAVRHFSQTGVRVKMCFHHEIRYMIKYIEEDVQLLFLYCTALAYTPYTFLVLTICFMRKKLMEVLLTVSCIDVRFVV